MKTKYAEVGQLPSDLTSSVCATILSYSKTHHFPNHESVSGPLLEEMVETNGWFADLTDFTEEMLWDDIGIVAGKEYRHSVYERVGYTIEGERARSPEICS